MALHETSHYTSNNDHSESRYPWTTTDDDTMSFQLNEWLRFCGDDFYFSSAIIFFS